MIISVINHSNGKPRDEEILPVIRAINRQIKEDFEPYRSIGAQLRLEGKSDQAPSKQKPAGMIGDAVIYLWDKVNVDDTIGYHDSNSLGIPYGFVFLEIARQLKENWSVTLSHEALELIGDPKVNLLVMGPHPDPKKKHDVFFWYEMCDVMQDESYQIHGVNVSNFLLPLYFTGGDEYDGRNDFLGTINKDKSTLKSFGVNPGGYVGFFDPLLKNHTTYLKDEKAKE